jgi:plasmid replication initiation protein
MALKGDYLVEKRNVLNEMIANGWTLQEFRFLAIYLAKINARDPENSRVVRFSLKDFQKIMELKNIKTKDIRPTFERLLQKIVYVPLDKRGAFSTFQLFKECKIDINEDGERYVEIDAHDKALPLMFDYKQDYFTYRLWNTLRLSSSNQQRIYEILKQYEFIGTREIIISELRNLIGIAPNDYQRWGDFKIWVLDKCQKALLEHTDIKYTYVPIKKGNGKTSPVVGVKFFIEKNKDYIDQLTLDEFIEAHEYYEEPDVITDDIHKQMHRDNMEMYSDICDNEFSFEQVQILFNFLIALKLDTRGTEAANYLKRMYDELKYQATKSIINNRFDYLKSILNNKLKEAGLE